PFAAQMQYQLKQLPLQPFNPYVEANTWLTLQTGTLSVDGDIKLDTSDTTAIALGMNINMADVKAQDTRSGKNVLKWKALDVQQLQLDLQQRTMVIDTVQVQQPDVAASIGNDKQ